MNYSSLISKSNTLEELSDVKELFLKECNEQEKRIAVAEEIRKINNFGDIKHIFESITPQLFKSTDGRRKIASYTKEIKENNSLKSEYLLYEGIKENKGKLKGEAYLNEALEILGTVNKKELHEGTKKLIPILVESLKLIGTEDLEWIEKNKNNAKINESIDFLLTNKKNLLNLGEHSENFNIVSDFINLSEKKEENSINIPLDRTLSEIIDDFRTKSEKGINENENFYDEIINSKDKKELFENYKLSCIKSIDELLKCSSSKETEKLNEMKEKLSEKEYNYSSLTNDIIKFKDLKETLNEIWEQK